MIFQKLSVISGLLVMSGIPFTAFCFSETGTAGGKELPKKAEAMAAPAAASKSKILVVYYSRTGYTKKVAEEIAAVMGCDIEEIIDTKDRSGIFGYIGSGRDAMKKNLTVIKAIRNDPANYDTIIIGTPVWAGLMSAPVRTYIVQNKGKLKNAAFFCTMGGRGDKKTFADMEAASGKKPFATLTVLDKEIKDGSYKAKVVEFVKSLAGK